MKDALSTLLGTTLIVGSVIAFRHARSMWTTEDYQLNSRQDSWFDFENRIGTYCVSVLMMVVGAALIGRTILVLLGW